MKDRGLVALLFFLFSVSEAKKFERCKLARLLKKEGLDKYKKITIADWICMIHHESQFNTRAVKGPDSQGYRSYGIFQIRGYWWCTSGTSKPRFGCRTYCKAFMDDDIADDIKCLKLIMREPQRINTWAGWKKYCWNKNLTKWTKDCEL